MTIFSAPNYCGEFDNAGAMMTVDETLMCSFQILRPVENRKPKFGFGSKTSFKASALYKSLHLLVLESCWCTVFW